MSTSIQIQVENIKCGGCINSIKKELMNIRGITAVDVSKETETVELYGTSIDREEAINKLAEMGYPEKGNNSLLSKAKSFISCAVGKVSA
jgi:copper chaperone CopZ